MKAGYNLLFIRQASYSLMDLAVFSFKSGFLFWFGLIWFLEGNRIYSLGTWCALVWGWSAYVLLLFGCFLCLSPQLKREYQRGEQLESTINIQCDSVLTYQRPQVSILAIIIMKKLFFYGTL